MCLAVPAKVIEINNNLAKVDYGGVTREIDISLVETKLGEYVIVHAGFAIQTIDEEVKDVFGNLIVLNKPFIVPDLCIGCGLCQSECPVQDRPAAYVTAVGESRSQSRRLLLQLRNSETS